MFATLYALSSNPHDELANAPIYGDGIKELRGKFLEVKDKNYITDFVYSFIALLKKQVRFTEYLKSLKGELVAAGTSLFSSQEIMNADSGLVVDTNKVFMDTGIYPKGW